MAASFDIDTSKARIELSKLMGMVSRLGKSADAVNAATDKMDGKWVASVEKMVAASRDAEARFRSLSKATSAFGTALKNADVLNRYSKMMLELNAAMDQSTINAVKTANAIKLTNDGYRTAELVAKERLKTAEASVTADARTAETLKRVAISLEQIATANGKALAIEQQRLKGLGQLAVEEQRQADATALRAEQTRVLNTEAGKQAAVSKVQYDSEVKLATAEARQAAAIKETAKAIELLQGPEGQRLVQLKATESALKTAATLDQQRAETTAKLRQELEYFSSDEGKQQAVLEASVKASKQAATADLDRAAALEKLRRELEYAQSAEGQEAAVLKATIKAQNDASAAGVSRAAAAEKLRRELEYAQSAEGKGEAALKATIKAQNDASAAVVNRAAATEKLRRELAYAQSAEGKEAAVLAVTVKAQNEANAVAASRVAATEKLRRELEYAQSAEGKEAAVIRATIKAQNEAAQAEINRAAALEKLRRELEYAQSAEGKEAAVLRASIRAQNEANAASVARATSMRLGNQLTSGLRAGLMGLRTSIGMYTSSTILAAAATFGIARAFRSGLEAGGEFTAVMARTEALMGSIPAESAALEAQVRILGATTQFTTTEVAKASTELALVGMTAGQALVALKPVLNLAIIGNTSVAQSAKLATDVMLIFGKGVGDLGHITDIYATAVAHSSANLDELVNAITYAGPAAHALGISLEDTTAAVETLANAGLRGSRAGTALRMMFDRLADPAGAGVKRMKELNISITDISGNAMSLGEILQMLQDRMKGLSGVQKLSALGDIFGVRQASAIANLLANANNFTKLRTQLELAQGAADKMVEQLRDATKFDWKNLKSAFEALQISVFKNNEYAIRSTIERLRAFVLYLTESVNGGVTRFEEYVTRIVRGGEAIALVYGGIKLAQFARGLMMTSVRLREQADIYAMIAAGATRAEIAAQGYSAAAMRASVPKPAPVASATAATAATAGGAIAMGTGAATARSIGAGVLAVGSKALMVLGWAGVAVSAAMTLWQVYKMFTDSGVPKSESELDARAAKYKADYDMYKKEADSRTQAQSVKVMEQARDTQVRNTKEIEDNIAALKTRKEVMLSVAKTVEERSAVEKTFSALLDDQASKLAAAKQAAIDMNAALADLAHPKTSPLDLVKGSLAKQIDEVKKEIDEASKSGMKFGEMFGTPDEMEANNERLVRLRGILKDLMDQLDRANNGGVSGVAQPVKQFLQNYELLAATNQQIITDALTANEVKEARQAQDLKAAWDSAQSRAEAAKRIVEQLDKAQMATAGSGKQMADAQAAVAFQLNAAKNAAEEYAKVLPNLQRLQQQFSDIELKWALNDMSTTQKRAYWTQQYTDAMKKRNEELAKGKDGNLGTLLLAEQAADKAKDALAALDKPKRTPSTKSIDTFLSNLRAQLDPISEAANKAREALKKLDEQAAKGKVSGNEKGLLAGQIEYGQLQTTLGFSAAPLKEQIKSIEDWRQAQLKLADAIADTTKRQQVQNQINREADALANQRKATLESERQALQDYHDALMEQETALQRQMDDRVSALGMGSQEATQQQAITKTYRDQADALQKLYKERDRAINQAMQSDAPDKGDKVARLTAQYAKEEQELKDHYDRERVITEKGYHDLLAAQGDMMVGVRGGLSQVIEDGTNLAGKMQQAVVGGFNDMADAIVNFAKTGKFSLREFADNFAEMMLRISISVLQARAATPILGWLGLGAGAGAAASGIGGAGADWSTLANGIFAAHGVAFDRGNVTAMAKGGLITKPTLFPMANGGVAMGGEAGTEAIMPLKRLANGNLGIQVDMDQVETRRGRAPNQIFNIAVQPTSTRRTAEQIATATARRQQLAQMRQ